MIPVLDPKSGELYGEVAEILPNVLYFASFEDEEFPVTDPEVRYVYIDDRVHYEPFYTDFGPLNLSVLFRFCRYINGLVAAKSKRKICCFTNAEEENRVNGAFIVASYAMIYHNMSADQAYLKIKAAEGPQFVGFRDAAMGEPTYLLHIHDVLRGVEKGLEHGWLNFETFDPDEYEHYERVENGDFNWIIPGKILSFCGPHAKSVIENGYPYHAPDVYFEYFNDRNVSTIVRLNLKMYEASKFTDAGFKHVDLFFIDGSTPSDDIVEKFIDVVDTSTGAVAIHCKAGLGRTGTLIACWMMKEYGLTAAECMGWLRVCRPGSVIGPQQQYLIRKQKFCWSMANNNLIVQLPAKSKRRESTEKSDGSEKKSVTKLANQVDEIRLCNGNGVVNGNVSMPINGKNENIPRTRPNILSVRSAKGLVDETALDSQGRSQGDRLLAMKVRSQHNHPLSQTRQIPFGNMSPLQSKDQERKADKRYESLRSHFNGNSITVNGASTPNATTSTRSDLRSSGRSVHHINGNNLLPIQSPQLSRLYQSSPRFSSPTTPIKPISASSSPATIHSRPRLAARNLLGTPTSVKSFAVPISKVTVTSGGSRALATSRSTSSIKKLQNGKTSRHAARMRSRPYPSNGIRIEMPPTSNYELRPRRSPSPKNYGMSIAYTLPPNTEALIGKTRALKNKYTPSRIASTSRLHSAKY